MNALITTCCRDIKGKRRLSASFQLASRWNEKCEEAFSAIKLELTSATVLGFADYSQPVIVETDASEFGLGAVLSQIQDGKARIIAYVSRGLHKLEKNKSNYSSKKLVWCRQLLRGIDQNDKAASRNTRQCCGGSRTGASNRG